MLFVYRCFAEMQYFFTTQSGSIPLGEQSSPVLSCLRTMTTLTIYLFVEPPRYCLWYGVTSHNQLRFLRYSLPSFGRKTFLSPLANAFGLPVNRIIYIKTVHAVRLEWDLDHTIDRSAMLPIVVQ